MRVTTVEELVEVLHTEMEKAAPSLQILITQDITLRYYDPKEADGPQWWKPRDYKSLDFLPDYNEYNFDLLCLILADLGEL